RIEQVDLAALPLNRDQRQVERHLLLDLVRIIVGDGGAFVYVADTVDRARIIERGVHQRGLSRPTMRDHGHVANLLRAIDVHNESVLSTLANRIGGVAPSHAADYQRTDAGLERSGASG